MELSLEEKQELECIYLSFLNNEKIKRMQSIPMHRGSNCYLHSFRVAKFAVNLGLKHKNVNIKTILIASILHDYYLYDWRKEKDKKAKHLSSHPSIAISNAEIDFKIDEDIKAIIKSHMWPLNLKDYPKSREAKIVSFSDKRIATREFLTSKKYKEKHMDKYLKDISYLFNEKEEK